MTVTCILLGCTLLFAIVRFLKWLFFPILNAYYGNDNVVYPSEDQFLNTETNEYDKFPTFDQPPTVTLSIIVPAYNEEERMRSMLDCTISYLKQREHRSKDSDHPFSWEILIVDDGSSDRTNQIAQEYSRQYSSQSIRVVTEHHNRGKGGAIKWGVLRSRGEYCLMADADGATRIEDVEHLEAALREDHYDIAVGSRKGDSKEGQAKRSPLRLFFMNCFHIAVEIISGIKDIRDTQCGFKLFTRRSASILFNTLHIYRWAFDIELLIIASQTGLKVKEVPVHWVEIPGSKVNIITASVTMLRDMISTRFAYLIGFWTIQRDSAVRK